VDQAAVARVQVIIVRLVHVLAITVAHQVDQVVLVHVLAIIAAVLRQVGVQATVVLQAVLLEALTVQEVLPLVVLPVVEVAEAVADVDKL
jgi:hypothetical protein